MAATFNPALATNLDRVRQKIGDTVVARAQIQDETIQAYLGLPMTVLGTARQLALDLAAKWASIGDVTVDDQMQRGSKIAEHYVALAQRLALEEVPVGTASSAVSNVMVGGIGDCRGPLDDCCSPDRSWWLYGVRSGP